MIGSTLAQSWNWLGIKLIYIANPDIDGYQVVLMRSFFAVLLITMGINKNLKYVMYDSFPSDLKSKMLLRITLGCFAILTMNFAVKYFSLSVIGVLINLNPLLTMLLGWAILKETVSKLDVVCIFIVFASVLMMILGMKNDPEKPQEEISLLGKIIFMVLLPLSAALINICMRMLKNLNENTI